MSVLILKNIASEGPGTIEDFLRENSRDFSVVDLTAGRLSSPADADTVVIMGGPMSVNETDSYPYIREEIDLVQDFIRRGKKILGICLGAQIMARALGARVYPGPEKEIGWYDIELQENSVKDPLIRRLAMDPRTGALSMRIKVFQWHGETFDLPQGAERIGRSALYENQAFRFGRNAYAFQFHIETTKEMIYDWLKDQPVDMKMLKRETESLYEHYRERAMNFYQAFFAPIHGGQE